MTDEQKTKFAVKVGQWIVKIFGPINSKWGKISMAIAAMLAALVSVGTWMANDFQGDMLQNVIDTIKQLFTTINGQ